MIDDKINFSYIHTESYTYTGMKERVVKEKKMEMKNKIKSIKV